MKWIALVFDYESPYRHYIENERIKVVSKDLYDTYSWSGVNKPEMKTAVNKYKELQFDPLDEQLLAFNKKINEFTNLINNTFLNDENAEMLQKLMIGVEKILKTRQALLDAIERRGERQKIAGDKGLSFLENRKKIKEL
jgi:phosphomevalonate kinase